MRSTRLIAAATLAATLTVPLVTVSAAEAAGPAWTENCTALNKKFPHGLGKAGARDRTSGTPVTTFKRSTKLYNIADRANGGLDRDNDGVACEKA